MKDIFLLCHNLIKLNFPRFYIVIYAFILISAFLQLVGTISIIPLITMLVYPEFILSNEYVVKYINVENYSNQELTIFFGISFLFFILISQLFLFTNAILNSFITTLITHNLRKEYYKKIFKQYLTLYLRVNISRISTIVGTEIGKVGDHINSYLSIIRDTLILFSIFVGLFFIEPKTLIGGLLGSLLFYILYLKSKIILKKVSSNVHKINIKFGVISSLINLGIREIIILGLKKQIIQNFDILKKDLIKMNIKGAIALTYPRNLIEIIIYFVIVIYFLSLPTNTIEISEIPIYAFYFFAIWKCIPASFGLYRNFSAIQINYSSIENLSYLDEQISLAKKFNLKKKAISKFKNQIIVKDILFKYPKSNKEFKFNLKIKKGEKILVSGNSGSGKTTLMNIISGLLIPLKGKIFIDNTDIRQDVDGFLKTLSYVTQFNYFFEDSMVENITFKKKLNYKEKVELKKIYKICGLNNIINKFEDIYTFKLKLNAPELSGGQRQRLALARVLFLKPQILMIDEGLNSLDIQSETKIIKQILKYYPKITLIFSSHRPIRGIFNRRININ